MEILDRLTLKEKIGQLNQDTGNTDNIDVLKEKIRRGEVGSLILATSATAGNDEQSKPLLEAINELHRVAVSSSPNLWDECITDVRKHDVVVLALGESHLVTGEANSLSRIELPPEQLELVKKIHRLGKPIIGVMCFGRPIALGDAQEYFDAILYSWHSGT